MRKVLGGKRGSVLLLVYVGWIGRGLLGECTLILSAF